MSTDSYGQNIDIAALTDAPSAFALAFAIVDGLTPQSVMRFASATARNATLTSPVAGMTAYLTTEQALTVYTGSAWVTMATTPGAWTTYTPTWTALTTNPSLGNGTLIGKYSLNGKTCSAHVNLTMGSSTGYGSGDWRFALPFTSINDGTTRIGNVHALSVGGLRFGGDFVISPNQAASGGWVAISSTNTALEALDNNSPFTWAVGDQLRMTFEYETA